MVGRLELDEFTVNPLYAWKEKRYDVAKRVLGRFYES